MRFGGSVCESNAPLTPKMPIAGFEDRESHRTPFASAMHKRPSGTRTACGCDSASRNGDCISAGHARLRLVTDADAATLSGRGLLLHYFRSYRHDHPQVFLR